MQIYLSFDYELFFGSYSGTVQKCIIEPTELLQKLALKHHIPFIFFVDAGYLLRLKHYSQFKECSSDLESISRQLKQLVEQGHQIGLHVHPHWEDCEYVNGKWEMNTKRYKLSNLSKEEAAKVISSYTNMLRQITGVKINTYRAGGWCVQPFAHIKDALKQNGISIDSSVYHNGYHSSPAHSYDFRLAPKISEWNFENDCCVEDTAGSFKEVSITPDKIGPSFYWNLYFKMKSSPEKYKPMGDGLWLKDKERVYKQFYSSTNHFACADGFFASRLKKNMLQCEQNKASHMMVLSHPKSLAPCSFDLLNEFIQFCKERNHEFSILN